jgi:tetratricopeptide (TPR) repeat protein
MADKLTRMELEEPDKLHVLFDEFVAYVSHNRKKIAMIATGVAAVLLLIAAWMIYDRIYEKNAAGQYLSAFQAENAGNAEGMAAALKQYREIVSSYPRSQAAVFAIYRLGNLSLRAGQYDEAIGFYDRFLDRASRKNDLRTVVLSGMGSAYEAKRDWKKALDYYEQAISTPPDNGFVSLNYQNAARIHEELDNKAKALDYYRKALAITQDPAVELLLKRKIALIS